MTISPDDIVGHIMEIKGDVGEMKGTLKTVAKDHTARINRLESTRWYERAVVIVGGALIGFKDRIL